MPRLLPSAGADSRAVQESAPWTAAELGLPRRLEMKAQRTWAGAPPDAFYS